MTLGIEVNSLLTAWSMNSQSSFVPPKWRKTKKTIAMVSSSYERIKEMGLFIHIEHSSSYKITFQKIHCIFFYFLKDRFDIVSIVRRDENYFLCLSSFLCNDNNKIGKSKDLNSIR